MPNDFEIINIGDRIDRHFDTEGACFSWESQHCELVMAFANLKPAEIRGVEQGTFEFGLNVIDQMPFLCFRIFEVVGAKGFAKPKQGKLVLPWQECPFHLAYFDPAILPHFDAFRAEPNAHLGIASILTTWPNMTVQALRFFTLSPFFTQKLIDALLSTAAAYTREGYSTAVQRIYATHPVNSIGESSRVRCKSGD